MRYAWVHEIIPRERLTYWISFLYHHHARYSISRLSGQSCGARMLEVKGCLKQGMGSNWAVSVHTAHNARHGIHYAFTPRGMHNCLCIAQNVKERLLSAGNRHGAHEHWPCIWARSLQKPSGYLKRFDAARMASYSNAASQRHRKLPA
jgi:hypothetical protein